VLRPEIKVKLLIVFKLMDIVGRGTMMHVEGQHYLDEIRKASEKRRRHWEAEAEKNAPVSREEFIARLRAKGVPELTIQNAVKGKFGE